jgi:hypothetical protein
MNVAAALIVDIIIIDVECTCLSNIGQCCFLVSSSSSSRSSSSCSSVRKNVTATIATIDKEKNRKQFKPVPRHEKKTQVTKCKDSRPERCAQK